MVFDLKAQIRYPGNYPGLQLVSHKPLLKYFFGVHISSLLYDALQPRSIATYYYAPDCEKEEVANVSVLWSLNIAGTLGFLESSGARELDP